MAFSIIVPRLQNTANKKPESIIPIYPFTNWGFEVPFVDLFAIFSNGPHF